MILTDLISTEDDVILLSIREPYFQDMLEGNKKYEYRKMFRKQPTKAIIYISKTKKSIVGMIDFAQPIIDTSAQIAHLAEQEGECAYQEMIDYLGEDKQGYAIPVNKIYLFEEEYKIHDLRQANINFMAPQSYMILREDADLLNFLKDKEIKRYE